MVAARPGHPRDNEAVRLVHVVRHAKSSWADEGLPDHERPLAPRGRRAARRLAAHLRAAGVRPDLVLCSSAVRARQTLDLLRPGLPDPVEVLVEGDLYGAPAAALLDRLRRLPDEVGAVMLVGHNPGLQDLVLTLAARGGDRARVRDGFPTAALATLAVPSGPWSGLGPGAAELAEYVIPRKGER